MRKSAIVIILLLGGCSRSTLEPTGVNSPVLPSGQAPRTAPTPAGLYKDEEIRKLAKFDIDEESKGGLWNFSRIPCLEVVPDGDSYPRAKVFKTLNFDDGRIRDFRQSGIDFVVFLTWQVSPSYDICCMTAINDPDNYGLQMTDPNRKVYGIRLIKRSK
jgi:hypothetical protein